MLDPVGARVRSMTRELDILDKIKSKVNNFTFDVNDLLGVNPTNK